MSNFDLILVIIALIIIIVLAICLVHYVNNHKNKRDDEDGSNQVPVIPDVPRIQASGNAGFLEGIGDKTLRFQFIDIQNKISYTNKDYVGTIINIEEEGDYMVNFGGSYIVETGEYTGSWSLLTYFKINDELYYNTQINMSQEKSQQLNQSMSILLKLRKNDKVSIQISSNTIASGQITYSVAAASFNMYKIA